MVVYRSWRRTRKPPEKVIIGPHQPRMRRIRTRQWVSSPRESLRIQSRNGVTLAPNDPSFVYNDELPGYEMCIDTVPNPNYFLPRTDIIDDGGEFWLTKTFWVRRSVSYNQDWVNHIRRNGHLWVNIPEKMDGLLPIKGAKAPPMEDGDIAGYGPTGYARAKPAQPEFNFGQSLAELRELPKSLKWRLEKFKDIPSAYVGAEFGWRPLLNDIYSLLDAGARVEERLQRLLKNNGKPVRGRAHVTSVRENSLLHEGSEGSVGISYSTWSWYKPFVPKPADAGYFRITKSYTRDVWFSGQFQFWLRDLSTPGKMLKLRAQLYGLEITPSLLWELMPWSWLIDWFSNVGELLENAVETIPERQIARYAYVMGHTTRAYTYTGSDGKHSAQATKYFVTKRRVPADRFGLTVEQSLTLRQSFLLGMLGLQRIGS